MSVDDPRAPIGHENPAWEWCEGVLWTEERQATYEPVPLAAESFDAALHVTPGDTESILAFTRAWGVLGPSVVSDCSLWATRRAFSELQRHFAWARALQSHEWRSPAVPNLWDDQDGFLVALRAVLPPPEHSKLAADLVRAVGLTDLQSVRRTYPDPYVAAFVKGHFYASWARRVRPRDREAHHWLAFGSAIGEHLRFVQPAVSWDNGRPVASWELPRLVDLLWVQLWNLVISGATMRPCQHCGKWFAVDHRGKVYCSRKCTNRASAKASYEARIKSATPRRRKRR